ncbi:DUF4470 domain-containing protein [Mycena sanguinolenta]|uniref:DUF4470 domain-containing protein n=1 Tax=Mycena sanguinolenta TaxID=230812 RepID=A0A8H6Z5T8_9AGAR|nr:DUF4470 domain-containing protein [Mycena sanguinolenta]
MAAKSWYYAVLAGFRKLRHHVDDKVESLESLMSFGMGSAPHDGGTVSHLMCGNSTNARSCPERGLNICPHCRLIKYCSEKCKTQHWPKHRSACTHPYLSDHWQPSWVTEGRDPAFLYPSNLVTLFRPTIDFWGDLPAMDCLQLPSNEGNNLEPLPDLKLCFAASGDLRNLIRTVNSLPWDYTGSGPSIEEAAELAVHLMYSAALPAASAEYLNRCINFIYASGGEFEADLSFRRCLDTRGEGKVYSVQPSAGLKRPLEMFHSNYTLAAALQSMKDTTLAPDRLDFREKYFAGLKPAHRMAFQRFRESGILAPFSLNTSNFTQPNRLLFSSQGTWMVPEDANALFGWDVGVQNSGVKHGTSPEDILGCLFFHAKDELREFARRVKELRIDIHLTSFEPAILAKGITVGALPAFEDASFDRILTSNLVDSVGLRACLADWGPLLNRENQYACILMQTKAWHTRQPYTDWGPHAMKVLEQKCNQVPGLDVKMKTVFAQGHRSPALFRIVESLEAFHDNESAFQDYLSDQNTEESAAAFDLQLRSTHRVHPKRFGIPLNAPRWQKLPDLSSNEFYDLFTIGGANLPVRFLEFESVGTTD